MDRVEIKVAVGCVQTTQRFCGIDVVITHWPSGSTNIHVTGVRTIWVKPPLIMGEIPSEVREDIQKRERSTVSVAKKSPVCL